MCFYVSVLGCMTKCTPAQVQCYVGHDTDCTKYINCTRVPFGYKDKELSCPHGLYWAGSNMALSQNDKLCELPSFVQCFTGI